MLEEVIDVVDAGLQFPLVDMMEEDEQACCNAFAEGVGGIEAVAA